MRVKIIFRTLLPTQTRRELERLKDYGLDLADVRVQVNCHTKGIIVDRRRVLIGSQNWSNHGVSVNRDASLLFEDAPLAEYFAAIFEHDWNNLAQPRIGSEWAPVEVAVPGAATPPGMRRLTWEDYDAEGSRRASHGMTQRLNLQRATVPTYNLQPDPGPPTDPAPISSL